MVNVTSGLTQPDNALRDIVLKYYAKTAKLKQHAMGLSSVYDKWLQMVKVPDFDCDHCQHKNK